MEPYEEAHLENKYFSKIISATERAFCEFPRVKKFRWYRKIFLRSEIAVSRRELGSKHFREATI